MFYWSAIKHVHRVLHSQRPPNYLPSHEQQQQQQQLSLGTYLLQYRPDVLERQGREFVLLEEVVQILLQHLEHQAGVVLVLEALERPHEVELVRTLLAEPAEDRHLDLALPRVRRMVLQDLDRDDVAGALLPAFHHLPERTAAKELEHLRKRNETRSGDIIEQARYFGYFFPVSYSVPIHKLINSCVSMHEAIFFLRRLKESGTLPVP